MQEKSVTDGHRTVSIEDIGGLIRRRWWLLALPVIIAGCAAWAVTDQMEPLYRAEAEVIIRTAESANLFPLSDATQLQRSPSAEAGFLSSTAYEGRAREVSGSSLAVAVDIGDISSRIEPSFIGFVATGTDPVEVARTAESWANTYVLMRHERDIEDNGQTIDTLEQSLAELTATRGEALSTLDSIDRAISLASDPTELAQLTTQRVAISQSLEATLAPIDAQLQAVGDELAELRLLEDFLGDAQLNARLNRVPTVPTSPVAPSLFANMVLALVVASLFGAALMVIAEAFDKRVRSVDEIVESTGLMNLAAIPAKRRDKGDPLVGQHGALVESFQRLASNVNLVTSDGEEPQVIAFTSAAEGEGKSTTVARLGQVLAKQGYRTVVVGADLRRPTLAERFGTPGRPGVGDVLMGTVPVEKAIMAAEGFPGLSVLPAGFVPLDTNPAELLRSGRLSSMVHALRGQFDRVLIDCPPVLPVVDAIEIAGTCDTVVMNAFAGRSRLEHVREAVAILERSADAEVSGFVLVGGHATGGYGTGYYRSTGANSLPLSVQRRRDDQAVPETPQAVPAMTSTGAMEIDKVYLAPTEPLPTLPKPLVESLDLSFIEDAKHQTGSANGASGLVRVREARTALQSVSGNGTAEPSIHVATRGQTA